MLYVFHVDHGRMLTFDMNWLCKDVRKLKETIERHHGVPAKQIVLLISGGEMLHDNRRVYSRETGTDTNPIFMFSVGDAKSPPVPSIEAEIDLKAQVEKCLQLPPTYGTLGSRTQLGKKILEMTKEELKRCENMVHEQHWQQQGWAAVIANMEDLIAEFQERCDDFYRYYEEHLQRYDEYTTILKNFDKELQQLADIPILSTLMENADTRPYGVFYEACNESDDAGASTSINNGKAGNICHESVDDAAEDGVASSTTEEPPCETAPDVVIPPVAPADDLDLTDTDRAKSISLLDWISASEGQRTLACMAEECQRGLGNFNQVQLDGLKDRVAKASESSQREDIKAIKGLEERLSGLDQLIAEAKKLVQDQSELAQSLEMNQNRANTVGDSSVLPDLCIMNRSTLNLMLEKHNRMREYRRRCSKAKDELGNHLTIRLPYITRVQTKVYDLDNTLLFNLKSLKRLQRHLGIIEQIHMAPCMYVSAVTEVVRRRMFSCSFLRWASDLACRLMTIYNEEVMRRQEFTSQFEGHFLSSLFPGMADMPPSYAIQAPSVFDSSLPALDKQDLLNLSRLLPELTEKIPLPNIDSVIDFFSSRSVDNKSSVLPEMGVDSSENRSSTTSGVVPSAAAKTSSTTGNDGDSMGPSNVPVQEQQCESRGNESETDTEEFEKLGQSPIDRKKRSTEGAAAVLGRSSKVSTCSMATSTEPVAKVSAETLTEVRSNPNTNTTTNNSLSTKTTLADDGVPLRDERIDSSSSHTRKGSSSSGNSVSGSSKNSSDSKQSQSCSAGTSQQENFSPGCPVIPEELPDPTVTTGDRVDGSDGTFAPRRCPSLPSPVDNGRRMRRQLFLSSARTSTSDRSGSQDAANGDEEFIDSEFYIDESLPSSAASAEQRQQQLQQQEIRQAIAGTMTMCCGSYDAETVILLLQDNLGSTRLEVERQQDILRSVYQLSQASICVLREQLSNLRAESDTSRSQFLRTLGSIKKAWFDVQELARNRERETIQQLTVDHELEMNDLRKSIHQKDDEIQSLRADNVTLKASHIETVSSYERESKNLNDQISQMREVVSRLEKQLADSEVDRKKAIQEAVDQLEHKHKTEIESLRCRYKLMASMDRSPSDTSLEKIEKPDMIDIASHEQMLAMAKEDFQREKERAIKAAIEEERLRWEGSTLTVGRQQSQQHRSVAGSPGTPTSSQDVYKRILEEKDRNLDEHKEKVALLMRENNRLRETIQTLTDPELSSNQTNLREEIETLQNEKHGFMQQVKQLGRTVESLTDAKQLLSKELEKQRKGVFVLDSCTKGDKVIFVWNTNYSQYTVCMQNADFIFFLHDISYVDFGLKLPPPGKVPSVLHGLGIVLEKDFCHARKDNNRYGVPRGTQFYRVKLMPVCSESSKSKSNRSGSSRSGGSGGGGGSIGSSSSTTVSSPSSSSTVEFVGGHMAPGAGGSSASNRLIDSFAQTEQQLQSPGLIDDGNSTSKLTASDMVDSGVAEQQRSIHKERLISITDEEDAPLLTMDGSTGGRERYASVCEEEMDDPDELESGGSATMQASSCSKSFEAESCVPTGTGNSAANQPSTDVVDHAATTINPVAAPGDLLMIPDDVSDSADSEYRSLETKDDDSDALNLSYEQHLTR